MKNVMQIIVLGSVNVLAIGALSTPAFHTAVASSGHEEKAADSTLGIASRLQVYPGKKTLLEPFEPVKVEAEILTAQVLHLYQVA